MPSCHLDSFVMSARPRHCDNTKLFYLAPSLAMVIAATCPEPLKHSFCSTNRYSIGAPWRKCRLSRTHGTVQQQVAEHSDAFLPRKRGSISLKREWLSCRFGEDMLSPVSILTFEPIGSSSFASSRERTGISSRTGYTRGMRRHLSPDSSLSTPNAKKLRGSRLLQTGQNHGSRGYVDSPLTAPLETSLRLRDCTVPNAVVRGGTPRGRGISPRPYISDPRP